MNDKILYLHVGMQKTATTSIQLTCSINRGLLKTESYLYPASWSNWHVLEIGTLFSYEPEEERRNLIHRSTLARKQLENRRLEILDSLSNEITMNDSDNIVLSAESIILYSKDTIKQLKKYINEYLNIHNIKVVICTRNVIDFANSITQQRAKSSICVDDKKIVNLPIYFNGINKFIEIFGKENLIVFKYEDACSCAHGPVGFFLKQIGLKENRLADIEYVKTNESLSNLAFDLMKYINDILPFDNEGVIGEGRCVGDLAVFEKIRGKKFAIDYALQQEILHKSMDDIAWLKDNFGIEYDNISLAKPSEICFDEFYFEDISGIFPVLNTKMKKVVHDYIKLKSRSMSDNKSKLILGRLSSFMQADFDAFEQADKVVYYSCVIDDSPKFYWQGYIFVNVLVYLAKVSGDRIFIHLTKSNIQFENFLRENSVNIKYIEPWGDKKYCNKLQQFETKELRSADYIWFCDADIAITEDLADIASQHVDRVLGKIVDFPNPDIEKLKSVYDYFGIRYPKISTDTLTFEETFEGNFNGGLYGIPSRYIVRLGKSWKKFATEMLNSEKVKDILVEKIIHIDQISFSLALKELNLPYETLACECNCPTHIDNINLLGTKLQSKVKVIHYHNNISNIGLLNTIEQPYLIESIAQVNGVIKQHFNNAFFWDYRYATNPELGSGIGSRGGVAQYKLRLVKNIGLEKEKSVLDIGCGDLEIVKNLSFLRYTGVDISAEAVANGKEKFPQFNFYNFDTEKEKILNSDVVLCLDVLIHQPTRKDYDDLIKFVTIHANKRVIISGYEREIDNSHMCFFYENIKESLEKTGLFKYLYKVGEYRGLSVYIADKGSLMETNTSNDISNDIIDEVLKLEYINNDLLLETITFSRANFGWYTKHYPRLYEYPWLLEKIGSNLENLTMADFGAGITPLPFQFAQRGAKVITIDKHEKKVDIKHVENENEWGFFDYSVLHDSIQSYNKALDKNIFAIKSIDIWYSISVVEHMPAFVRRFIIKIMADTLKVNGRLFLTIDLIKDSQKLWNMAEGKIVEDENEHGTLDSFVSELEELGFIIEERDIYRMPKDERVDIAMISGILKGKNDLI